ncbi:unnamed protein product [Cylindrotheca closterium]|uniref:DNRLRE domain-containing protein n=1 Tax=Cylindrotheca closterium TaxID=2856 RepID=A0AAD2CNN0_9STRA|nr:unnamed protein product [Cylindrotheca closterium]
MTRHLLLPLLLSPAFTNAQTVPDGHTPGNTEHQHGFRLCNMKDDKMLVGEISLSQDATLFAGFSSSTASMEKFVAGRTPDGVRRALLSFDLSSVNWPSDVQVACAEVRLAVDPHASVSPPSTNGMTLHEVTKDWTTNGITALDGTNGGDAQHGDATWNYASFPSEEWDTPGGDFAGDTLSRETIVSSADGIKYAYFGSTKRMHAVVNEWIRNPSNNHGMMIKADELADDPVGYNVYHGIENNPSLIPKLVVVYTAPSLGYEHQEHLEHHTQNPISNNLGGILNDDPSNSNPISTDGNINQPTETPTEIGDGQFLGNVKPTFPPINNDAQKQTYVNPGKRQSNSNHEYIAIAAICTVVSVVLVGLSVLSMRAGVPQPPQMSADEVIGSDLSLDTEREIV